MNPYSQLQAAYGLSLGALGEFTEGERLCEKGLSFAYEINHLFSIGVAEFYYGWLFNIKGDGESAVKHHQGAIEYWEKSQARNLLPIAWICLGWGYFLLEKPDSALEAEEKGLNMLAERGQPLFLSFYHNVLSGVHLDRGSLSEARRHAEEALNLARTGHQRSVEAQLLIQLGRIIGKTDMSDTGTAEGYIFQGMKISDELKMKPTYASGHLALGELYTGAEQKGKALENLKRAGAMCREMGMEYWLGRTKKLLESLEREIQ